MDAYSMIIDAIKENLILASLIGGAFLVYGLTEFAKGQAVRFICVCAALLISPLFIGLLMAAIQITTSADWHISLGY
ncbi:MAG TPA: hypothetical protein VM659_22850 [Dongiaceae bacterium]|nr:hypothetical protein [Dongiaceae bacterium]